MRSESDHEQQPDFRRQELSDVDAQGLGNGDWVVNKAMLEHVNVTVEPQRTMSGGVPVQDDHITNTDEILVTGFSGYNFSIVCDKQC